MAQVNTFMTKPQQHPFWHEVAAVFFMGISLLLLLALLSFDSGDVHFFRDPPNDPLHNYIGPVGAYFSGFLFFVIGVEAYMLPIIFFGLGLLFIFRPTVNLSLKFILALLLLVSGAAFLQLTQPFLGSSIRSPIETTYAHKGIAGGIIGYFINDCFLALYMGSVGSAILIGTTNLASFLLLFEINPVQLVRLAVERSRRAFYEWEAAKFESADPVERITYEKKLLEREQRDLERKLAKKNFFQTEAKDEEKLARPAPKVLDTTVRPAPEEKIKEYEKPELPQKKQPEVTAPIPTESKAVYDNYTMPEVTLLEANDSDGKPTASETDLRADQQQLIETLAEFSVEVSPGDITRGATITRYEVFPATGVRVERIVSLGKNIARAMKAERINIIAPIPGKDTVGIEVANSRKSKIVLRDLFESTEWTQNRGRLPIALGKDIYGRVIIDDLAEMPHMLIAGTTGSGKSVCINCLLLSLLYRFSPEDLRIILVDPKVVELQVYNSLPHLVVPVVTDPKKVLIALRWVIQEMEKRYQWMAKMGVRNIVAYNAKSQAKENQLSLGLEKSTPSHEPPLPKKLPYVVVIIDELADLMQTTPADVENAIARLSAKARAAGIHLVIATQTPRASVITGIIKTNVPARVAFQVPSALDSRVILDENGAENLLGKGDLLYLKPGSSKMTRAQGAYVSEEEVAQVVSFIAQQAPPSYDTVIQDKIDRSSEDEGEEISDKDEELIEKCIEVIRQEKRASTSLLQRRLKIGYGRAAWVIDQLESRGIVGPKDGAKDREILVDLDQMDGDSSDKS